MCSKEAALNFIWLIVLLNNCIFNFATTTATNTNHLIGNNANITWLKNSTSPSSSHYHQNDGVSNDVRRHHLYNAYDNLENILLHASENDDDDVDHAHQPTANHADEIVADEQVTSGGNDDDDDGGGGHFIDITRKHKIHYNGIVIDENNLVEHLKDHERDLIFGKSRKKRSLKLVHLTYRPIATIATKTTKTNYHPTDGTPNEEEEEEENNELEVQIPNNTLETTTKASSLHRFKRSNNEIKKVTTVEAEVEEAEAITTTASGEATASKIQEKIQGGASSLPVVSVQIKDNDHLVSLKLQQTSKLIDDAFIFIRRYANSSQLVENSHKLAERLEKCFYHNENAALDLCDDENVRGVFQHNQTDYAIHPLPQRFGANNTHIIIETEKELFDTTLWANSTSFLNETLQFEPELEDFNDLNNNAQNTSTITTTRSTRNIEPEAYNTQQNNGQAADHEGTGHHKHRLAFNLRYRPRHHHHHHHSQSHSHPHSHLHSHTHPHVTSNHHSNKRHSQHPSEKYHSIEPKMSKRSRRFISSSKQWQNPDILHIETAIFVDTDLYKHMAKNFPTDTSAHVIRFVLAMINGVQLLYHHPSLGRRVSFVLKRLEILEKDPMDLRRSSDIDTYLSNFCKWQTKLNPLKDSDPMHYDHAVILTGLDLYVVNKNGKLISQVVGLAPVAGMCLPTSSCTINEGKHFESVFVVAHEIGHNLGMRHDTTDNACDPTSHIMSPTLGSGKITWSKCSRDSLTKFLEKEQATCLFNRAEFSHNLDHSAEGILPGERFNADQQCMLKYGKESKRALSQALSDICRDLHCQRERYTWTSHPALEGTACGDNMWCHSGLCVMKRAEALTSSKHTLGQLKSNYDKSNFLENPKASNLVHEYQKPSSSWSEWSEPSLCDSFCLYGPSKRLREGSTGLRTFTRKCVDYKRRCMGRDRKFETCVAKQCFSVPIVTIGEYAKQVCERAQKFDSDLTGEGEQVIGNIEESCKVYCRTKSNGTKSRSWPFPDGTTCRSKLYGNDEPAYCIQGRCEKFSCDNSSANYYKIDKIFCKQQDTKPNDNTMDNDTIRRSSSGQQSYSNHIPVGSASVGGAGAQSSSKYNSYDRYDNYRNNPNPNQNSNPSSNYYDRNPGGGDEGFYGPTTVRNRYENEVAVRPYHGQYNHDYSTYKRKSDVVPPWNKYSYNLNDHMPPKSPPPPPPPPTVPAENEWIVKSGCYSSCVARSKGIQVIVNRRTGVRNIQLCTHASKACDRLQTPSEFADQICSRYKLKVRGLSGHGTQIAASVEDPDRSCRVGCQDELTLHRFYLVNGNYGHFPLGTRCSNVDDRYCVRGKCLEFGSDQIPLQQSHISLALFRSRRSAKKSQGKEQHIRHKRSFLYYDPVNITETLTQDFINNIVNSIITQEEKPMKDDSLLDTHIEFTNPIHYSMGEANDG